MFLCGHCTTGQTEQGEMILRDSMVGHGKMEKGQAGAIADDTLFLLTNQIKLRQSKFEQYLAQCRATNKSFEDHQFPPNESSLCLEIPNRKIVWKRIPDVIKDCVFVESGISSEDIEQGNVGDCYFLAAISSLAQQPDRIRAIFDDKLEINGYGLYKLIVNHRGTVTEMVIDDYVPFFAETNRPVCCKARGRQIWVMLLQKAWAKICGSYGQISQGYPHEVLNTFSIAPCFDFEIKPNMSQDQIDNIWSHLRQATQRGYAVCSGSKQSTTSGIKQSHTYTVLGSYFTKVQKTYFKLIKMRNPWGNTEYEGKCSQSDHTFWNKVDPISRLLLFPEGEKNDGLFIIPYDQFLKNFNTVDITHSHSLFNADLIETTFEPNETKYFQLNLLEDSQSYITIEKQFRFKKSSLNSYGYSRILLTRLRSDDSYEYIYSKLETNLPDLSLGCKLLKAGVYVIMVQLASLSNNQFKATLSSYCEKKAELKQTDKPTQHFLTELFQDNSLKMTAKRISIGTEKDDWAVMQFLDKEGGFGYVTAHLSDNCKTTLSFQLNNHQIEQNGFLLEERSRQFMTKEMSAGMMETIVFSINMREGAPKEALSFPPKGFNVIRTI